MQCDFQVGNSFFLQSLIMAHGDKVWLGLSRNDFVDDDKKTELHVI